MDNTCSVNKEFDAIRVDAEVKSIEIKINNSWKIVLNVTEFLCGDLNEVVIGEENVYGIKSLPMVDTVENEFTDYKP